MTSSLQWRGTRPKIHFANRRIGCGRENCSLTQRHGSIQIVVLILINVAHTSLCCKKAVQCNVHSAKNIRLLKVTCICKNACNFYPHRNPCCMGFKPRYRAITNSTRSSLVDTSAGRPLLATVVEGLHDAKTFTSLKASQEGEKHGGLTSLGAAKTAVVGARTGSGRAAEAVRLAGNNAHLLTKAGVAAHTIKAHIHKVRAVSAAAYELALLADHVGSTSAKTASTKAVLLVIHASVEILLEDKVDTGANTVRGHNRAADTGNRVVHLVRVLKDMEVLALARSIAPVRALQ